MLLGSRSVLRRAGTLVIALAIMSFGAGQVAQAQPAGSSEMTYGLTPELATAYSLAHQEAARQLVPLWITSGYRTWDEQQQLWASALVQYGTPAEAQRWVLPPDRSTHVTGEAIDVAPYQGALWLEANGNRWGLCRTYANEWWHFEVVTVPGGVCPPMIADAATR